MKIIIHRKKQFASSLVPFYIAINKEKDEIINAITNKEEIMVYPIKSGETIEFDREKFDGESTKVYVFSDKKF